MQRVAMDVSQWKQSAAQAWSAGAEVYAKEAHGGSAVLAPLAKHFVELAKQRIHPHHSARVLDIASGPGEPAFSIAAALPHVHVTATDFAAGLVEHARQLAEIRGLTNVSTAVADGEDLHQFPEASFDLVTCCEGLIMMPHPDKALAEWRRVLKPGGSVILATWAPFDGRMQVGALQKEAAMGVVAAAGVAMPPSPKLDLVSDLPTLLRRVSDAGFKDADGREFNVPMRILPGHARAVFADNPMATMLQQHLEAAGIEDAKDRFDKAIMSTAEAQGFLQPDGSLDIPTNVALVVTATAA